MARKEIKPLSEYKLNEYPEICKIADFYGFLPSKAPAVSKIDLQISKLMNEDHFGSEKSAVMSMYLEGMQNLPQPIMFWFERPFPKGLAKKKANRFDFSLYTVNSSRSVSECISIQTIFNILNSIGYKNLSIRINSIGDKESFADFERKLSIFIRKNIANFPQDLKQAIKKDPFVMVKEKNEKWAEFQKDCPQSIEFLTESSRLHLKEILEYMEIMGIAYNVDGRLIGDKLCSTETLLEIYDEDTREILAEGMRWNKIAKALGAKKDISNFTINVSLKVAKALKKIKAKKSDYKFYLIQFGPEAKNKSFLVLNTLRKENINVLHSMAKDKLSSQIASAENLSIPYIILMGQKEALENSVVIRDTSTREQHIVSIPDLGNYIRKMKVS